MAAQSTVAGGRRLHYWRLASLLLAGAALTGVFILAVSRLAVPMLSVQRQAVGALLLGVLLVGVLLVLALLGVIVFRATRRLAALTGSEPTPVPPNPAVDSEGPSQP